MPESSESKPTYLREVQITSKKKRVKNGSPVGKEVIDAQQVYELFQDLQNEQKEKMITLHLDAKNNIICFELAALGSLNAIYLRPMEVFRSSFAVNANAAIVIHNHPSGDPGPSGPDKELTEKLAELSKNMGMTFYDHIIIGEGEYFSFADRPAPQVSPD